MAIALEENEGAQHSPALTFIIYGARRGGAFHLSLTWTTPFTPPSFRLDDEYLGIWSRATALCEQPEHEHAHAHGP